MCEAGTGQQVAQLYDSYMMMVIMMMRMMVIMNSSGLLGIAIEQKTNENVCSVDMFCFIRQKNITFTKVALFSKVYCRTIF
jgi:hypothetical protein